MDLNTSESGEDHHQHKLVYLGDIRGEVGGKYPLYQCRECGATFEAFEGGKYAVFYPEWTVERATKGQESTKFVSGKTQARKKLGSRALGKSYIQIQSEQAPAGRGFAALFGGQNDNEER